MANTGEIRRATRRAVGWSLGIALACALAAGWRSEIVAAGIVLGGASGALGLWLMQRRLETIASVPKERLQRTIFEWMGVRMVIYAVAFGAAYAIDRVHTYGLLGAVAGMLVFRGVFIGMTLFQNRRRKNAA